MKMELNPHTNEFDMVAETNNSKTFELSGNTVIVCVLGVDCTYTGLRKSDNITAISVSVNGSPIAPLTMPFSVLQDDELEFQISYPQHEPAYFTLVD